MSNVTIQTSFVPANVTSYGLSNVSLSVPKAFPNGNSNIASKVDFYVDRYNGYLCKSADAVIGLGETLVDAKQTLEEKSFKLFLERTGLNSSKSTYSKLMKIGENADRLRPYVNNLPQTWTTLYELSKLEADQFESIASQLNAYSTAKEIALLLGSNSANKKANSIDVTVTLDELDLDTKMKVLAEIENLQKTYTFGLKVSPALKTEISNFNQKLAA